MILDIRNVSKHFGGLKALDACSLKVETGKITAIIGPNGSGKSTLFNVIAGLYPLTAGTILFDGTDISRYPDYRIARLGISRTFQEVRLFSNLTIKDHLDIAVHTKDERAVYNFLFPKDGVETKKFLRQVSLDKPIDTFVTDLSYGQRKLLDLAIAIAKPHHLLMLDEPVAGVNPKLRKDIKEILRELNRKGETILLIEHDMNFVMDLADHVIVLDEGRVIAEGKPKQIQDNKKVLNAYLGE